MSDLNIRNGELGDSVRSKLNGTIDRNNILSNLSDYIFSDDVAKLKYKTDNILSEGDYTPVNPTSDSYYTEINRLWNLGFRSFLSPSINLSNIPIVNYQSSGLEISYPITSNVGVLDRPNSSEDSQISGAVTIDTDGQFVSLTEDEPRWTYRLNKGTQTDKSLGLYDSITHNQIVPFSFGSNFSSSTPITVGPYSGFTVTQTRVDSGNSDSRICFNSDALIGDGQFVIIFQKSPSGYDTVRAFINGIQYEINVFTSEVVTGSGDVTIYEYLDDYWILIVSQTFATASAGSIRFGYYATNLTNTVETFNILTCYTTNATDQTIENNIRISDANTALTRGRDLLTYSNMETHIGQQEGSLLVQGFPLDRGRWIRFSDTSSLTESARVLFFTVTDISLQINLIKNVTAIGTTIGISSQELNKYLITYDLNTVKIYFNGFLVFEDVGDYEPFVNALSFLQAGNISEEASGDIKNIAFCKTVLTEADAISATEWTSFTEMATDLNYQIQ